jgi:hypothetical protein
MNLLGFIIGWLRMSTYGYELRTRKLVGSLLAWALVKLDDVTWREGVGLRLYIRV